MLLLAFASPGGVDRIIVTVSKWLHYGLACGSVVGHHAIQYLTDFSLLSAMVVI